MDTLHNRNGFNPDPRHLLTRLQREWDRLATAPAALATARRWHIWSPDASSLDGLLLRCGYGSIVPSTGTGTDGGDVVLRDLVELASTDALAARVVLQRLLPGISAMARRNCRPGIDVLDTADEAVSTAWTVIRLYPIEQRPTYVAVNLLREIEYQAFRKERRRKCEFVATQSPAFDLLASREISPCAVDELRELLADARTAGFPASDLELVERLGTGVKAEEIAAERKVTPRTIRNHRAVVAHRLRRLAIAS
jgi:DNA-directed RNA polymerase specialized sigma24 family protein